MVYDNDQPVDTIYKPGIRLFFGAEGAPDSITVSKCYMGVKDDGTYFERTADGKQYPGMVYATYSVFFTKTVPGTTTVEFGLEAYGNLANAGANGFGFGDNQILFLGDEQQYMADTRTELGRVVSTAQDISSTVTGYWGVKLNRYINDAQQATTAKDMQNALHGMREVISRVGGDTEGIVEIETAKPETLQGIYDLNGRRMKASTLPKGIYVVNGKKRIVK